MVCKHISLYKCQCTYIFFTLGNLLGEKEPNPPVVGNSVWIVNFSMVVFDEVDVKGCWKLGDNDVSNRFSFLFFSTLLSSCSRNRLFGMITLDDLELCVGKTNCFLTGTFLTFLTLISSFPFFALSKRVLAMLLLPF